MFAKSSVIAACVLSVAASLPAFASPTQTTYLQVQNGDFVPSATGAAPKGAFTNDGAGDPRVTPSNWSGGTGLIYVDATGAQATSSMHGLAVYGPFPNSPDGGNFVQADGNPTYGSPFYQTITGLTVGTTYTLGFWQAAGQQTGFGNGIPTTEQWIVSLGTSALSARTSGGPTDPVYGATGSYYNTDANASITQSALMTTPSGGVTTWQYVTVNLTADATTDILSFLAWGDNGATANMPPIVFLSGVSTVPVPEPASLSLLGLGMVGLGLARRRRNRAV